MNRTNINENILMSPSNRIELTQSAKKNDFTVNCYCGKISGKRVFLPCIGLLSLVTFESMQSYVYLPILVSFVSFILFWNFPELVYISNTRPLYYEDLFIDNDLLTIGKDPQTPGNAIVINPVIRQRFEKKFLWTLIFTNTLFMGGLADYWLYKSNYDNTNDIEYENDYYEIVGVTGGILKIFQFFNNTIGSIMLHFIYKQLKKEHHIAERRLLAAKKQRELLEVEMVDFDTIRHTVTESPPANQKLPVTIVRDYLHDDDNDDNEKEMTGKKGKEGNDEKFNIKIEV